MVMFKRFLSLFVLLISYTTLAERIVAIVNDYPITSKEFEDRKYMIKVMNKLNNINKQQQQDLERTVLDSLISEQLFLEQAQKLGMKVTEEELTDAINNIDKSHTFPKSINDFLAKNNINKEAFSRKVKAEIIRTKIVQHLGSSIEISKNEVEEAVTDNNQKETRVYLKVFSSDSQSETDHKNMVNLKRKLKSCNRIPKYPNITMKEMVGNISDLPPQFHAIANYLKLNQVSNVIKTEQTYSVLIVCDKFINNLSQDENQYVINLLGNKKLMMKAHKYYENLKKRAYIKIY